MLMNLSKNLQNILNIAKLFTSKAFTAGDEAKLPAAVSSIMATKLKKHQKMM